jgi:replicative DNA helicase
MVLFIHRPEYYGFLEDEEGNSLVGLAEIIVAKHRNGAVGDIKLRFRKEQAKFSDLDDNFAPFATPVGASSQAVSYQSKMNEDPLSGSYGDSDFDISSGNKNDDEIPY